MDELSEFLRLVTWCAWSGMSRVRNPRHSGVNGGGFVRITPRKSLDIQLAGYSRPRSVAMALVRDILAINVVPCDAKGLPRRLPSWSETNAALPSRDGKGF